MNILALESSTEACSAALLTNGGEIFSEFDLAPRKHTEYLPRMVQTVLEKANLERTALSSITYSNGPGAFTGVRIAASMAQGMAIGLGVSLLPISTLAVLAQQACDELDVTQVSAAIDARMGEVYCGLFDKDAATGLVRPAGAESLIKIADLETPGGVFAVGSGYRARQEAGFSEVDVTRIFPDIWQTAAALVKLAAEKLRQGQQTSADAASINYIRNQVAWKKSTP